MSEAVTVPSLIMMMMTLIVSEDSLARDTETDTHSHTQTRCPLSEAVSKSKYFQKKTNMSGRVLDLCI